MVLQRETNAPVWGECRPGYYVKITTSWDQKQYTTQADADGHFMQSVATPKAGGPYTVTLTEAKSPRQKGRSVTLHNVMIGEVWLCGGQSNMQLEVEWGRVSNYQDEVRKANNHPDIRLLHVATTAAATPQSTLNAVDGGWQACSSQSVRMFSATAYFFGRELEASLNMPIGLIESCLGSTFAEPWISAGALSQMPYFDEAVAKVAAMPADSMARERQYQSDLEEWNTRVSRQDGNTNYADGRHSIIYNKVFTDSSLWTDIQVPGLFEDQLKDRYGAFDGIVWYRRQINIPESWTGKDLILRLGAVDDDDVTFFNGVEVGSHLGVAFNREYPVPGTLVREGKEEVAVRLHDTGGLGGFYSSEMRLERADGEGEPIALAGTWQFLASLDEKQLPFYPTNLNRDTNVPSALFNGMIRPLIPYALRGAIWYQGESSVGRAYQYRELLPVLINDWRTQWGSSMPFYIVQLANYMSPQTEAGEESTWAELREAQQKVAQSMADCGLATTIDIGEADDIHPKNKQDVGLRLALLARANTYGERVECLGPQYSHYRQEGNSVRLFFTHAEGLKAGSDRLKGFVIAGPDRKFHWAKAHIEGRTVVVSADEVPFPVAVRYGWANNPDCNLYNAADLPATPFRTDEWPGLSVNNY
ncbi:MAG: 9-O-acetylesterase [Prevotella sp.]|nr:9-O-acetylesterase [Prevotella sp.]